MTQYMGNPTAHRPHVTTLSLPDDIEIKFVYVYNEGITSVQYRVRVRTQWSKYVNLDIPTLLGNVVVFFKDGSPHVFLLGDEITLFTRT